MQKVLLLLFTIGWGPLAAQTTEFFTVELGGGYTQLVDEPFSPLLYSGWSGHFILGNITERPRSEWSSRFQGGFGSLSASIDNGGRYATSSVTSYLFSFELANYRLVHTWGKGGLWLGGAWNTQFDLRMYNLFTNNIAGHELRSTLDVGTFFRYALTDRHRLQTGVQFPLVGAASRPNYIGVVGFEEDLDSDILGMLLPDEFVSWHNLRVVQTHVQWRWIQKNAHQLNLIYRWQGGINLQTRRLAYGRHQLGIGYSFLTKRLKP
jgi:hypothetical protein